MNDIEITERQFKYLNEIEVALHDLRLLKDDLKIKEKINFIRLLCREAKKSVHGIISGHNVVWKRDKPVR